MILSRLKASNNCKPRSKIMLDVIRKKIETAETNSRIPQSFPFPWEIFILLEWKKKARRWKNPEDKGATLIRRSGGTRARLCKAWVSQESRSKERVSRKNFILFTERGFLARVCCNDGPHGFPRRSTMWRSRRGAWKEQGRRFSATELSSRALSFRRPINVGQPTHSSLSKPASLASHNEKGTSLNQRRCMEENRERERERRKTSEREKYRKGEWEGGEWEEKEKILVDTLVYSEAVSKCLGFLPDNNCAACVEKFPLFI